MIQSIKTLPDRLCVAISGGVDSLVMAHYAKSMGRDVTLLYFDHGDAVSRYELESVHKFAQKNDLLVLVEVNKEKSSGSIENFWRKCRYEWFHSFHEPVATGHNLDDAVEWYLMTCLRGQGQFMEYSNQNVIRPLILSKKSDIIEYANVNCIEWFEDPTNADVEWTIRNRIRHNILPECLLINPGLYKTVKQRIFEKVHK